VIKNNSKKATENSPQPKNPEHQMTKTHDGIPTNHSKHEREEPVAFTNEERKKEGI
jgi:hypothetical protein